MPSLRPPGEACICVAARLLQFILGGHTADKVLAGGDFDPVVHAFQTPSQQTAPEMVKSALVPKDHLLASSDAVIDFSWLSTRVRMQTSTSLV
jgi:hypothetical protein